MMTSGKPLTDREKEYIMSHIDTEFPQVIADRLDISRKAVTTHVKRERERIGL
jgi:predicted DNA-binding protein YlxM (UPF0122 family)